MSKAFADAVHGQPCPQFSGSLSFLLCFYLRPACPLSGRNPRPCRCRKLAAWSASTVVCRAASVAAPAADVTKGGNSIVKAVKFARETVTFLAQLSYYSRYISHLEFLSRHK